MGENHADLPVVRLLARKILSIGDASVSQRARNWATVAVLDTLGATLAGSREPCATILLDTPGIADAPGPALVLGTERRTSALDAALINGTASHALDYDDVSGVMGGHPSVPLVAPLMALGETLPVTGRDFLLSYVVGFETETRLARCVNLHHYDKGWHPTSTLGVFGAAAAASHMLKLDEEQLATALALAASFASGIKANFGTMTKPLHVGRCARDGLLAALLAARGFEANHRALEANQGFLNVYNGAGNYDLDHLTGDDWAAPLEVEDPSIGLKQFPCCGSTHPAIAAMLKLVREEGLTPDQVSGIEILAHRRRLPHTNNPNPVSSLGAKFSIQYATARALKSGTVRLEHFEGDAHLDPEVRRLVELTSTGPHPGMPDDSPNQFGAEVIVTCLDGRRLSRRIDHLVGRGPDDPMSEDELWEKFSDCAGRVLPREGIAPLFDRLVNLSAVSDLKQLTRMMELRSRPPGPKAPATSERQAATAPVETSWVP